MHKDQRQLLSELDKLKSLIKIGGKFECPGFPETDYVVTDFAFVEKTEVSCIVYKKRDGAQFSWVRTLDEYTNKSVLKTNKDRKDLLKEIELLDLKINEGDRFCHYKHPDHFYKVIALGFVESTGETCIVYQAEYGDRITWVRTENEFFSKATLEDGSSVDRFVKVS